MCIEFEQMIQIVFVILLFSTIFVNEAESQGIVLRHPIVVIRNILGSVAQDTLFRQYYLYFEDRKHYLYVIFKILFQSILTL